MKVGDLVKFVAAPGRWKGEKPRCPGHHIVGKHAIVTAHVGSDSKGWGDRWTVLCDGIILDHWGDFMEAAE